MGDVISLAERRVDRGLAPPAGPRRTATFYFDLASPYTYLAADRVERALGRVAWRPAYSDALLRADPWRDPAAGERLRESADRRAVALRMPLVWPEGAPLQARAMMRAAAFAAEQGRGGPFALAASRLAYCGGFDLDDPEVLAEAAAAAGIGLRDCLRAARDATRDEDLTATGRRLLAAGADRLPAVQVGRHLVCGEERLGEAAACAESRAARRRVNQR
jgi:2-hydroxychromene-2-carboxylate isomerase